MKNEKYTTVINGNEKIVKHENKLDAIIKAWETKMTGNTVKVIDDETCKTIYR
jgi:hypothetical protein